MGNRDTTTWQDLTIRMDRSELARHRDPLAGVQGHHGFPQYLGGAYRQSLVRLPSDLHYLYHRELDHNRIVGLPRRRGYSYYQQLSGPQMLSVLKRVVRHARQFDQRYGTGILPALRTGIRQARPLAGRRWPRSSGQSLPPPLPRGIRQSQPMPGRRWTRSTVLPRRQREAFSQSLLQYGSRGPSVREIQHRFNQWLKSTGRPTLVVDGIFGSRVQAAVRAFQRAVGLTVDGIVGPETQRALRTVTTAYSPAPQPSPPSTSQLAQQVLNHPNILLWQYSPIASGTSDGADALNNIRDIAVGLSARRSSYGNAPGGTVNLNPRMLQGMLQLADTYNIRITSIAGGSHSPTSRHYAGVAFDIDKINGTPVNFSNPDYQALMRRCRALGATEVLGPGDAGHNTHVHCAWPRR